VQSSRLRRLRRGPTHRFACRRPWTEPCLHGACGSDAGILRASCSASRPARNRAVDRCNFLSRAYDSRWCRRGPRRTSNTPAAEEAYHRRTFVGWNAGHGPRAGASGPGCRAPFDRSRSDDLCRLSERVGRGPRQTHRGAWKAPKAAQAKLRSTTHLRGSSTKPRLASVCLITSSWMPCLAAACSAASPV
jgi:hypothetical protein